MVLNKRVKSRDEGLDMLVKHIELKWQYQALPTKLTALNRLYYRYIKPFMTESDSIGAMAQELVEAERVHLEYNPKTDGVLLFPTKAIHELAEQGKTHTHYIDEISARGLV